MKFETECIGKDLESIGVYCGCPKCNPVPKITDEQKAEQDKIRNEQIAEQDKKTKIKQEHKLKVGDLFETSWGYDQTNYEYIVVIEISPSGKTAICKRTSYETIDDNEQSPQAYKQKPVNKPFGDKFRLKVDKRYNDEISLRGSYPFLHTGEGSKRLGSFSLVLENEVFYETNPIFGH